MHEWRKDVKTLWYALEPLRPIAPAPLGALIRDARRLSEVLGEDHDLALLSTQVAGCHGDDDSCRAVLATIGARRRRLQQQALKRGAALYSETPGGFERRLHSAWKKWLAAIDDVADRAR